MSGTPGGAGRASELAQQPAVYVHVPFCEAKCSYCDFYSVARGDAPIHRYVEALRAEGARRAPPGLRASSVFIGGGTPTALTDREFEDVLSITRDVAAWDAPVEWTVECNPGSLTRAKATLMHEAGVSRVSIGVQSFDDRLLRSVGRVHTANEAREAVDFARSAGIGQISIDLLFAVPGQGIATFRRDLDAAIELETDHVSAYALLYEDGTTLTRMLDDGRVTPEEEETELEMLRIARDTLGEAGLERYEISNFARTGCECRHNLNYWRNGAYLGLGPGAVSYLGGTRRGTVASWRDWQVASLEGRDIVVSQESLRGNRAAAEELMLRLRLREGAHLASVDGRWGTRLSGLLGPLLGRLEQAGLTSVDGDGTLRITDAGLPVADGILAEILAVAADAEGP